MGTDGSFDFRFTPIEHERQPGADPSEHGLDDKLIEQMLRGAELRQIYTVLNMIGTQLSRVSGFVGGIQSDDIDIEVDPETGRSNWSIKREVVEEAVAQVDLGTAEKERMVYQRLDDDEGTPVYGWDFVRSVAATEE